MVDNPSNGVLAEQIRQLRKEFQEFKKETREETRELEREVEIAREVANRTDYSLGYVKDTVSEMKDMLSNFVKVQNQQNEKIEQFINSDTRHARKKELIVSVLQVFSGIIIAILGFWATGNL